MNSVNLIGRLVKDVDLKFVPSTGKAVARYTLAVDFEIPKEKIEKLKLEGKPTADFINILTYGKTAESCAKYLGKGKLCGVSGRLSTSSYKTNLGEKRYTTTVITTSVKFLEKNNIKNNKGVDDFLAEKNS